MNNKIKYSILGILILILWLFCRAYINIEVSKKIHKVVDNYEEKITELKVRLETDKIELEKSLKHELILSKTELDKCKLEKETENKKKEYSKLSKSNPKEFKKQVNKTLGVKEKSK